MTAAERARVDEHRRVLDLAARHQVAMSYTADGWQLDVVDVDAILAAAPLADELVAVPA